MKTLPSCICILGFAAVAAAGPSYLIDQIGPDDGTNIDVSNILANQIFEAAYAQYSISVTDDFDNADGSDLLTVEFVMGGWNGYAGPDGVSGWQVNVHSTVAAACDDIAGDLLSWDAPAGSSSYEDFGGLAGYSKVMLELGGAFIGGGTGLAISAIPSNEFGVNGQVGMAIGFIGDLSATQNNPAGGFGFGACQAGNANAAVRIASGQGDPCNGALPATCAADVSGADGNPDGAVNVSDLLAVIANWNAQGDGTSRPQGDCAPMPNGDCVVNVSDLLAVIGDWGSDCVDKGSCCFDDGSCNDNVAEADCSGAWGGAGSDCATDCLSGACCATDGSCSTTTADGCSGNYSGDGTDCADVTCNEAPANNECSGATAVADGPNDVTNVGATTNGPADFTACDNFDNEQSYNDVYYSYTTSITGQLLITTCNTVDFDNRLAVYDACGGTMVACNDDALSGTCGLNSEIIMDVQAGESYIIQLGSFADGGTGSGVMNIFNTAYEAGACCIGTSQCVDGLTPPDCVAFGGTHQGGATDCATVDCDPTPANDTCEGATEAVIGANAFDTTFANPEWADPDDLVCDGTFLDWAGSSDVFFTWTATSDGALSITTCDAASYDTSIAVYNTCDGDGTHNIACNGDATGQDGCQSYYSAIDNLAVTSGDQIIIRCGGWNGATGAGTLTLTFTGGNETAACCVGGSCAGETTLSDCTALGGLWVQGETCATVSCPQPFAGCTGNEDINEADLGCPCFVDGDDSLTDCNPGLNGDGTESPYTMGATVCGTGSVFLDVSGSTYRDTDWWDDGGAVDAGGTFSLVVGSGAAQLLGLVDKDAGAFIDYSINTAGFVADPYDVTVTAGNHCIWIGPSDFNVEWTCDSGLADYVFSVN